jgi:uncharacterized protein (UPF0548 family)
MPRTHLPVSEKFWSALSEACKPVARSAEMSTQRFVFLCSPKSQIPIQLAHRRLERRAIIPPVVLEPTSNVFAIPAILFALGFPKDKVMFCWSKPSRNSVLAFISAQQSKNFSYAEVGCSRHQAPNGYTADHSRIKLGAGADAFKRAKCAVTQWKMFDMPWIELCRPDTFIEPGATVAVVVSHLGFWSMNACRIVYVIEEHGSPERYGFAYGTLPGHGEIGEERFTVELNVDDQTVWYDIYAFSRPSALARLAYPFTRGLQKRFARESKAAMQRAVQSTTG